MTSRLFAICCCLWKVNKRRWNQLRCQDGCPHVIKEKGPLRLYCIVNQNWYQTVPQLSAQCSTGPGKSGSKHNIQRTLLDTGLHSRHSICVPLLIERHCQQHLQWYWENQDWTMDKWKNPGYDFSFITSMVVSGYTIFQANSCHPPPPCYSRSLNRLVAQ